MDHVHCPVIRMHCANEQFSVVTVQVERYSRNASWFCYEKLSIQHLATYRYDKNKDTSYLWGVEMQFYAASSIWYFRMHIFSKDYGCNRNYWHEPTVRSMMINNVVSNSDMMQAYVLYFTYTLDFLFTLWYDLSCSRCITKMTVTHAYSKLRSILLLKGLGRHVYELGKQYSVPRHVSKNQVGGRGHERGNSSLGYKKTHLAPEHRTRVGGE